MADIPFPVSSSPGIHPVLGQGRLMNAYALKEGERYLWKRVPGLKPFAEVVNEPVRGMAWSGLDLIVVAGTKVFRIDQNGIVKELNGDIYGAGPVCIARNNNVTPDIIIVAQTVTMQVGSDHIFPYPDGVIGSPKSVSSLDGYLIFTSDDGTIRASDLNTTEISALSFARAESSPDRLLRGIVSAQLFYAMGTSSIEIFQDVGTSPFPLQRVAVMPVGLMSRWAVAGGQQDGWSSKLIFVANDGTVREINGYQETIISSPDVTRDILRISNKENLVAQVYGFDGAAIWSLSSSDWTWEYNCSSGAWHQRKSWKKDFWRGCCACYAFGRWLVADSDSGKIMEINPDIFTELDDPLIFEIESDIVKAFPARMQCRRADFDFAVGFGSERGLDPIEIDPCVMISWSDDGGAGWSVPLQRNLGKEGMHRSLVSVLNTGTSSAHGRKWRISISDPVECTLMGGAMYNKIKVT